MGTLQRRARANRGAFVRERIEEARFRVANTDIMVVGRKVGSLFVLMFPLAMLVLTATLLSYSVPGLPSASLFLLSPVLAQHGIPVEGVGILIAVDAIPDMFKTTANVTATVAQYGQYCKISDLFSMTAIDDVVEYAAVRFGEAARKTIEALIGGNWLSKLGVLLLLIGVALFLGFSLTEMGPAGRIATGLATATGIDSLHLQR